MNYYDVFGYRIGSVTVYDLIRAETADRAAQKLRAKHPEVIFDFVSAEFRYKPF